jgi:hypothetical protein
VLESKASRGHMGTLASVLEAGQHWARRRSGGACAEVKAVPSEEQGGEKGLGFDDSPWALVERTACACGGGTSVGKRAARLASVGGTATQCLARIGD